MKFRAIEAGEYLRNDALSGGDYSGGFGYIAHVNVAQVLKAAEEDDDAKDNIAYSGMNDFSLRDCIEDHEDCPPALIIADGGYNSVEAHIHPDWSAGVEIIEGLENYPVVDDEALSEREMELADEAWESYIEGDVLNAITNNIDDDDDAERVSDYIDAHEDWLAEQFHQACEDHNCYAEFEGDGGVSYSALDDIAETIAEATLAEIDTSVRGSQLRAIRDGVMLSLDFGEVHAA